MLRFTFLFGLISFAGCNVGDALDQDKANSSESESGETEALDDACEGAPAQSAGWDAVDGSCVEKAQGSCGSEGKAAQFSTAAACTEAVLAAKPDAANEASWVAKDGVCIKIPPSKAADVATTKSQCEETLVGDVTLYGTCGEGVETFVPELEAGLEGKVCFISPPDSVTLEKWDESAQNLKSCAELGWDVNASKACDQKGVKCYADDEQETSCSDEATAGKKVRFRRTYTCDHYPEAMGCAASSRKVKNEIHYLGSAERTQLAAEILSVKPATYVYRPEANQPVGRHLGFIIEDQPLSASFVGRSGKNVDLYKYLTALVVTVQQQQAEIDELRRALENAAKEHP